MVEKSVVLLDHNEQSSAKESGVGRLKMAVWYNPEIAFDRQFGEKLVEVFQAVGCDMRTPNGTLMTPEGIIPGQEIKGATRRMFEEADLVHVVMSSASLRSQSRLYMPGLRGAYEVSDYQVPGNIYLVPIRLDETPLPNMFSGLTPLDLFKNDFKGAGNMLLRTWRAAAEQRGY